MRDFAPTLWRLGRGYEHDRDLRQESLVALEDLEAASPARAADETVDDERAVERLATLVRSLAPLDRQVILLHLEGLEPGAIAEVTGLTSTNVTTKVHRIKALLAKRFGME